MKARDRLIVSLDFSSDNEARKLMDTLGDTVNFYKVGFQLFTAYGPRIITLIKRKNKKIFLDLKFHDIPNTVANATDVICDLGVDMFNIHALGGFEMMETTVKTLWKKFSGREEKRPIVLGVTILTSLGDAFLKDVIGSQRSLREEVALLARAAQSSGCDGVVASPLEAKYIKKECGKDFIVLTPGIRLKGDELGDQVRVLGPKEAISSGADYIVVGRSITRAKDPKSRAEKILEEIEKASSSKKGY